MILYGSKDVVYFKLIIKNVLRLMVERISGLKCLFNVGLSLCLVQGSKTCQSDLLWCNI
jgi:hypothetical protein